MGKVARQQKSDEDRNPRSKLRDRDYDQLFQRLCKLEQMIEDSELPETADQKGGKPESDTRDSQPEPLQQQIDNLVSELARATDTIQELREQNDALRVRFDFWQSESQPSADRLGETFELIESARDEFNAAQELVLETRAKFDQAISQLLLQLPTRPESSSSEPSGSLPWNRLEAHHHQFFDAQVSAQKEPHGDEGTENAFSERDPASHSCWTGPSANACFRPPSDQPDEPPDGTAIEPGSTESSGPDIRETMEGGWRSAVEDGEMTSDAWSKEPTYEATALMSLPSEEDGQSQCDGRSRIDDFSPRAETDAPLDSTAGETADSSRSSADARDSGEIEGSDTCDDSIRSYINQLLHRVQGGSEHSISERISQLVTGSIADSDKSSPKQSKIADHDPDAELIPRSIAPETYDDISAMRDLANATARSAISRSIHAQTRQKKNQARLQFVYSVAAIVCGATLYYTAGELPRLLAIALIMMIATCFAREGITLLLEARRRLKSVENLPPADHDRDSPR